MSLVKVIDSETKELKRFETYDAKPLAIVKDGILEITVLGISEGYVVKDNQLIVYATGNLAY
jgi:hypothetical protein